MGDVLGGRESESGNGSDEQTSRASCGLARSRWAVVRRHARFSPPLGRHARSLAGKVALLPLGDGGLEVLVDEPKLVELNAVRRRRIKGGECERARRDETRQEAGAGVDDRCQRQRARAPFVLDRPCRDGLEGRMESWHGHTGARRGRSSIAGG